MLQIKNSNFKAILLALAFLSFSKSLFSQDYVIEDFIFDITLTEDGHLDIVEEIDVFFNVERRGIMRDIPKKALIDGKMQKFKLSNIEVPDHTFVILDEGNNKVIRIGDADTYLTGPIKYRIAYRLSNALIWKENHIELLYNLISNWDCPIQNVEYSLSIPEDFEIAFNDYKVITGNDGEDKREAILEKMGRVFKGRSMRPLQPDENITLAVKFPAGYILQPAKEPGIFQTDKFWYLPFLLIFFMFNSFFKSRKEYPSTSKTAEYYPPDNLCPAEVGAYHDNEVNVEDIIALLPFWANEGYIKIMGTLKDAQEKDLYFKKLKDLPEDKPEYQHLVFNDIFKKDNIIMLSELKNEIYGVVFKASSKIKASLLKKQMFDYDHYKTYHSGYFAFGGLALIIIAVVLMIVFKLFLTGIASIILGICAVIIHFLRPKDSEKGIRMKAKLEALKVFLKNDDGSKTYELIEKDEKYLESMYPYAVALGIDESWLWNLESSEFDFYGPAWYSYYGDTLSKRSVPISSFTNSFSVPEIKSVFTSAPASSGTGGGGGFSGGSAGGGVGGGGSSW